jgi:HAAS domain-containing protein
MNTQTTDDLVNDYLARLWAACGDMPPAQRAELVEDIRGHIASARAAGPDDEIAVRTLLDRLGEPEEIVAAARDGEPRGAGGPDGPPFAPGGPVGASGAMPALRRRGIGLEITAMVLITIGSCVPVLGWLAGVALTWTSRRWRLGEKLVATLVAPAGPGALVVLSALVPTSECTTYGDASTPTCTGFSFPTYVGIPLLLVWLIAPFVVAGVLLRRASNRAAVEPLVPVAPSRTREVVAVVLLCVLGTGLLVAAMVATLVGPWSPLTGFLYVMGILGWVAAVIYLVRPRQGDHP